MTLKPGTKLGRYKVLASIGEGGMGEVYRARDIQLEREVAIKVLRPKSAADPDCLKRFEREAKATAALSHPNILAIHDVGMEGNSPYLVEELLEGESLKSKLERGPIPADDAVRIAVQIARGLAAAHAKGIIHRDLKPGNVFISGEADVIKILDFGLAKLVEMVSLSQEVGLSQFPTGTTAAGHVLGTAGYLSPEQLRGLIVDHRSDIFSFGCLLYEMVTGKRAFPGDAIVSMAAILEKEPVPPHEIVPGIPPALDRVILKCLEKDRARRFQSAAELQQELESGEAGPPARLSTRFVSGIRKIGWTGWALLLLVALSATIFVYRHVRQSPLPIPDQKNLVVLPFTAVGAGRDQVYCDGMTETVTTKLAGVRALQVLPVSQVAERKVHTAEQARYELGATLVLRATWQRAEPRVRINMSLLDSRSGLALRSVSITASSSDLFDLQDQVVNNAVQMLEIALQESEANELGAHGTRQPSAYDYYLQGLGYLQDYTKLSNVNSAISLFNDALRQDPQYALAFSGLGQAYWRGYLLSQNSEMLDAALRACGRSLDTDPHLANGHACLGVVYNEKGEYEKAAAELGKAVQLNPNSDDFLRGLADAYQKLGKVEDAENALKKATALRPQYWANYSYLGAFYFRRVRYYEAAAMFRQVIKLAPDSFRGYYNLGGAYVAMDRLDEAIPVLQRSIEMFPTAAAYSNLGTVYMTRRQFPEAARVLERAVKLEGRFVSWANLGEALYFIPGRRPESLRPFQEAIRLAQLRLRDSPRDSNALSSVAYFKAMIGANEEARTYIRQSMAVEIGEPANLLRLAKASSRLDDDRQTTGLIEKFFSAGGSPAMITDAPHFDDLRARSARLRKMLEENQQKSKGVVL